jgi:hypothetical protein
LISSNLQYLLRGFGNALEAMARHVVSMKCDRMHRVLGEGNFVLTMSEGSFGDKHRADPPRAEWKNKNGKF